MAALRLAGAMGPGGGWAGGRGSLVQTGDAVDRGPDSLAVLSLLARLQVSPQPVSPSGPSSSHLGDRPTSRMCARRRVWGVRVVVAADGDAVWAFVCGEPRSAQGF